MYKTNKARTEATTQFHWNVIILTKFQMPAKIHKKAASMPPIRAAHNIHVGAETRQSGQEVSNFLNCKKVRCLFNYSEMLCQTKTQFKLLIHKILDNIVYC